MIAVQYIQDTLKDDCSFIAVEEDTGDIKGIRINRIGHRCGKYKNTDQFGVEMQSVATVSLLEIMLNPKKLYLLKLKYILTELIQVLKN